MIAASVRLNLKEPLRPSLIITLVGPDKPGLVEQVSNVAGEHGGNWLESRMCHLAGQFAGIVQVSGSSDVLKAIAADLEGLDDSGLQIQTQTDDTAATSEGGQTWSVSVVGNDRPGIVRELSSALAGQSVNVEELTTHCADAPHGGGAIFRAEAQVRLPTDLTIEQLQEALEGLASDLMVDVSPAGGSEG